jgi:hypothetical protein
MGEALLEEIMEVIFIETGNTTNPMRVIDDLFIRLNGTVNRNSPDYISVYIAYNQYITKRLFEKEAPTIFD